MESSPSKVRRSTNTSTERPPINITGLPHVHTDIIEEIIAEEIVDETDRYEDNQSKRRARRITTAAVMRGWVFPFFLPFILMTASAGYRIVERERRLDVASPNIDERSSLLSPGLIEVSDAGARNLVYGSLRHDPRP